MRLQNARTLPVHQGTAQHPSSFFILAEKAPFSAEGREGALEPSAPRQPAPSLGGTSSGPALLACLPPHSAPVHTTSLPGPHQFMSFYSYFFLHYLNFHPLSVTLYRAPDVAILNPAGTGLWQLMKEVVTSSTVLKGVPGPTTVRWLLPVSIWEQ